MDSLLNRSYSADLATLPTSLENSSRNSSAANNSAKRRIDLNTPVNNRNGKIEEDGRLVEEGGEDDLTQLKIQFSLMMVNYFGVLLPQ